MNHLPSEWLHLGQRKWEFSDISTISDPSLSTCSKRIFSIVLTKYFSTRPSGNSSSWILVFRIGFTFRHSNTATGVVSFPPSNCFEDSNKAIPRYHEVVPYVFIQISHVWFVNLFYLLILNLLVIYKNHIIIICIIIKCRIIDIAWLYIIVE